jgi:soluble lytic murein transglycosylase
MRGIGFTFSRLPAARALLAGAALLASASAQRAFAQNPDESAMAIPRITPRLGASVPLPQPLPPAEAVKLRRIFALQKSGEIAAAARETEALDLSVEVRGVKVGDAMLGHVLADRYLGRFTKPGADQLAAWLSNYSDLPYASAIRNLLVTRLPKGAKAPPDVPQLTLAIEGGADAPVPEESEPAGVSIRRNADLDRSVHEAARAGKRGAVARLIARTSGLSPTYEAQLRGEAGQILFTLNRDQEAYDTAAPGTGLCHGREGCQGAALAGYAAGLAAWRMGHPDLARPMFESAWRAQLTTSALKAGAAFWAARAHLRINDPASYVPWMTRAAAEQRTFYGFLARRTLGLGFGFGPGGREDRELLGIADVEAIGSRPAGLRAFALLQIGQDARAESELRLLWPDAQNNPSLGRAIMLVAQNAGLTELAAQLADLVQTSDGRPRDAMRFPIPHLRPSGGFTIDPAMVYGLARTESNFDANLVSSAGARGLMQIMPDTANFIVGSSTGATRGSLDDPEYNLNLGQRYVDYLARQDSVNGSLIRVLASYNCGPNRYAQWSANIQDQDDPLLFIEAIPIDETRAFVPRVLTYTWIYATRLRLPMSSLDELAAGAWPRYYAHSAVQGPLGRLH